MAPRWFNPSRVMAGNYGKHRVNIAMIEIREAGLPDAGAMADVLNPIIVAGGTTAYEVPLTPDEIAASFLSGPDVICCHVALDLDGKVAAFQYLGRNAKLPADIGDIASFARLEPRLPGAGTALIGPTKFIARQFGLNGINATIRADNVPGLAYYTKMGFQDHDIIRGVPLSDGTPVDRV